MNRLFATLMFSGLLLAASSVTTSADVPPNGFHRIVPTKIDPAADESAVKAAEKARMDAVVAKDMGALEKILADDLTYVHTTGVLENKKEYLAKLATGKMIYKGMEVETSTVRFYNGTGVTNGIVKISGVAADQPVNIRARYTAVYVKNKGTWQLAAWQTSKIPE